MSPRPHQRQCRQKRRHCGWCGRGFTRQCTDQPSCTIARSGSWLARANGAGSQCCSYNTHHRPNQPHQAFTPQAFTRWRRPCEEANILLQLTTHVIDLERMKGWVDLGGWLHTEIKCRLRKSNPDTLTHPSTNRARRRLTSLIRPTPLPLGRPPPPSLHVAAASA